LCAATINDTLYLGMSFGEASGVPFVWRPYKDYGVWKRVDGICMPVHGHNYNPNDNLQWRWIEVPEWEDTLNPGEHLRMGQFRGMTAIPDPNHPGNKLLAFHWDSPDAIIETLDPSNNYQSHVELSTKTFVQSQWGGGAYCITAGYNEWTPAVHPETNDSVHFIGAWANYPGGETGSVLGRSSWFFVRYSDASYNTLRIWDPNNVFLDTASNGLKGCRSIVASPFPEEAGYVWYFCGFDLTGSGTTSITGNKAWIYKGLLPNITTGVNTQNAAPFNFYLYPNPAMETLNIAIPCKSYNGNVFVYNQMGQVVLSEQKTGSQFQLDIRNLGRGLYFIRLWDEYGNAGIKKMIKQ